MKRKKRQGWFPYLIMLLCLAVGIVWLTDLFLKPFKRGELSLYSNESEDFRAMRLGGESMKYWLDFSEKAEADKWEVLSIFLASSDFDLEKASMKKLGESYDKDKEYYETWKKEELDILKASVEAVWKDVKYFPVVKSKRPGAPYTSYEDSWYGERNYQNTEHAHEGVDIMTSNNVRGYFPIVSMTDGVVERLGWLEKGGYRVGIRSPRGGYFYYAHLYRYAEGLKEGDTVMAGQLLGFMGDTGYSKVEGTVGNFDVHLHLGIYIKTEHYYELSVDPYWVLKYAEQNQIIADY